MLRVAVVDDERPARAKMRRALAELPDVEVVGEADGGAAAIATISDLHPDLVFLDVQMPGLDGFGVLTELQRAHIPLPAVVFVTAHDEFALRAFEVAALDYLLKPVDPDRIHRTVERARRAIAQDGPAMLQQRMDQLLRHLDARQPRYLERVLVTLDERSFFVPLSQVLRVAAARNYVQLHLAKESHAVRGTLAALEERLDPAQWIRINRSEIVNIEAIAHLEPWFHGEYRVVLRDGTRSTWSRRFLARAEELLGKSF